MTTINTIEDLIRLLDENPQWVEALRVRLLSRELIELPEKLAQFVEQTNQRFDWIDQRFERIDRRFDGIDQRLDKMDQRFDGMDQRFDGMDQRFDGIEADIRSINDHLGTLKGGHAQGLARRRAFRIAANLGSSLVRVLGPEETDSLVRGKDTSGIPSNELDSFLVADLLVEAEDGKGETVYIAVEASYTLDDRDTDRAMRNAGFLTRFTGRPAFAAVAGMRLDDRIRTVVESGEVYWYQMEERDMRVE